mmetsp:Transcript_117624/g.366413  ORF Transcript_117624/g.366413 Transcript_117624/m.366413 type:complete len:212 (-) Transcript_117624:577-1212(-)
MPRWRYTDRRPDIGCSWTMGCSTPEVAFTETRRDHRSCISGGKASKAPPWCANSVSPPPSGTRTMWYPTCEKTPTSKEPSLCHCGPTPVMPTCGSLLRRKMWRLGDSGCTPWVLCILRPPQSSLALHCSSPESTPWPEITRKPRAAISACKASRTAAGGSGPRRSKPATLAPIGWMASRAIPFSFKRATRLGSKLGTTALATRSGSKRSAC